MFIAVSSQSATFGLHSASFCQYMWATYSNGSDSKLTCGHLQAPWSTFPLYFRGAHKFFLAPPCPKPTAAVSFAALGALSSRFSSALPAELLIAEDNDPGPPYCPLIEKKRFMEPDRGAIEESPDGLLLASCSRGMTARSFGCLSLAR